MRSTRRKVTLGFDLTDFSVTKRTIARYRQKKLVSYYMIDGRTYYKASEVQTFLKKKGKDAAPSASTPAPEKSNPK